MTNPLEKAQQMGQSIWYDNIRRGMFASEELQHLVNLGVTGITSNPSIFDKAIAGSADYDRALAEIASEGLPAEKVFESLALEDIRNAADVLRPVYERTKGRDGYVSLEVRPTLAHDTDGTIIEAVRLFNSLQRPNVMIKVPATLEGFPAISRLIAAGINVNVTLIFSVAQYEAIAEAYLTGLEERLAKRDDISRAASVASVFVSRIDTKVDVALQNAGNSDLQGKVAIANAMITYARFKEIFSGARWEKLAAQGAHVQRPLWASTGTKNPAYPDTYYVDNLIAAGTVNTVPPATLKAFKDHGMSVERFSADEIMEAADRLKHLEEIGVDLDEITGQLLDEGVAAFAKSYESLLKSIEGKLAQLGRNWQVLEMRFGPYQPLVETALAEMRSEQVISRIWEHDYTLWKPAPDEITNRLGWLNSPATMPGAIPELHRLSENLRSDGYTHALLLGMGGSSLAPEVFRETFGVREGYLDLGVLDSTVPGAVLYWAKQLDLSRTLFIVSTKSGGTVETLSFFKYFYHLVSDRLGKKHAGEHFLAITDPGSKLAEIADIYDFRATYLNDQNIGGRYSALSYFGLVPAALVGVNIEKLLDRAMKGACNCDSSNCPHEGDNLGGRLGAFFGELAKAGRDKLTLITSPSIASFADWVEQLIAESTGKEGKGILPVVHESVGGPGDYGSDRFLVYMRLAGDSTHDKAVAALDEAGLPLVRIHLGDVYDLGAQFFIWEVATAVAGNRLEINPFNQPDVESAKTLARQMVTAYKADGKLPEIEPDIWDGGLSVYLDMAEKYVGNTIGEALNAFLQSATEDAYIAIQAYVLPSQETGKALQTLRAHLLSKTRLATSVGYGPRFLHSTGQLHKGDAGKGMFIQLTSDWNQDAPIPDEPDIGSSSMSFGVLNMAQALGDRKALLDNGRRVIRIHLGENVLDGLETVMKKMA